MTRLPSSFMGRIDRADNVLEAVWTAGPRTLPPARMDRSFAGMEDLEMAAAAAPAPPSAVIPGDAPREGP